MVPPVKPNPRPDILATLTPVAATRGATISVVVSATPPVLCLSTLTPSIIDKSRSFPDCAIASVKFTVSAFESPRNHTAISQADIW